MNIHEYQAKAILGEMGAPIAKGVPAFTVDEAAKAAGQLPGPVFVVKAQIHAGGRGKGRFKEPAAGDKGGVRLARSVAEVAENARIDQIGNEVDVVVYAEFADEAALAAYKAHPTYAEATRRVRPLRETRLAADFKAAEEAVLPVRRSA